MSGLVVRISAVQPLPTWRIFAGCWDADVDLRGWVHAATRAARSGWDVPSRRRSDVTYVSVDRLLWVVESTQLAAIELETPSLASPPALDLFSAVVS